MFNNKSINKSELHINLSKFLNLHSISNSEIESQIIISYVAGEEVFQKVIFKNINFESLEAIISERIKGKPLSKIINQKGFWNNIFYTDQNTLDPRADSEILIENILNDLSSLKKNDFFFIDLCCGTGCLGISLLEELRFSKCDFIDTSQAALDVCQRNISKMKVQNHSKIYKSDLFDSYPNEGLLKADFIVCNPPYILSKDYLHLDKSTLYDPKLALDGGNDGLSYYKKIVIYLKNLKFKGDVYFEVDPTVIEKLSKFLLDNDVKISYKKQDYLKLDRLLKITFP